MRKHVAIFVGSAIEKILLGEKTIESRFSLSRVLPYGEIVKDDTILLKQSGGDIIGQATVDNVLFYDNLNPKSIKILRDEYSEQIAADDSFWENKKGSQYGTLIFIKQPKRFAFYIKYKKKDRRPWVVIKETGSDGQKL